jgi:hypothetical protein
MTLYQFYLEYSVAQNTCYHAHYKEKILVKLRRFIIDPLKNTRFLKEILLFISSLIQGESFSYNFFQKQDRDLWFSSLEIGNKVTSKYEFKRF